MYGDVLGLVESRRHVETRLVRHKQQLTEDEPAGESEVRCTRCATLDDQLPVVYR